MNTYSRDYDTRHEERGVTIIFVALAMVAICAIAALSIDVITLYLAREEAQRSADAAALAAARVLSLSGVTGDPDNTQGDLPAPPWQTACNIAKQIAQAVVKQNVVGRAVVNSPTVTFLYNGTATDCTAGGAFAINPQVKVDIVQSGLPTYFARIWGRSQSQVSATATAEAFNPSNSLNISPNGLVRVTPRCVKPWIIPNRDPVNGGVQFVSLPEGRIQSAGIQLAPGTAPNAVIGERFALTNDCQTGNPDCKTLSNNPPINLPANRLEYVPAYIRRSSAIGVPSCATGSTYQEAVAGCDQNDDDQGLNTIYACGIAGGGATLDLTFNPGKQSGDSATATACLIHQSVGQDVLDTTQFPFQIQAGSGNPVITNNVVTSSNSIVTIPIYDDNVPFSAAVNYPPVNIVGFLQVFITSLDTGTGDINVTVLNVVGCSNTATAGATCSNPTGGTPAVCGTSPVPVRLITSQ